MEAEEALRPLHALITPETCLALRGPDGQVTKHTTVEDLVRALETRGAAWKGPPGSWVVDVAWR